MRRFFTKPTRQAVTIFVLGILVVIFATAAWTFFGPVAYRPTKNVKSILSPQSSDDDVYVHLRIMTYNIHHGRGADRQIDLARIVGVIQSSSPDVIAIQELDRVTKRSGRIDQLQELEKLTGMQGVFGKAKNHSGGQYGNAILSRFPIESVQNSPLPGGFCREPRSVIVAKIAVPTGNSQSADVMVFSTHLDFAPRPAARLASVERIQDILADNAGVPCILAGDMNAAVGSKTINRLRVDWSRISTRRTLPTYPATNPTREIDHLFCSPAERWIVFRVATVGDSMASDHLALLAEIGLAIQ